MSDIQQQKNYISKKVSQARQSQLRNRRKRTNKNKQQTKNTNIYPKTT